MTVDAREGDLLLQLRVVPSTQGISAEASLTNQGQQPWPYTAGGDLPPLVQIEARDAEGGLVYRWTPPFARAHWRAQRVLEPGESMEQRATIPTQGRVYVRAFVTGRPGLTTDEIQVPGA